VAASAGWLMRRSGKTAFHTRSAGPIGSVPGALQALPREAFALLELLQREAKTGLDPQAVTAAIVALNRADAVILGPLSPDDANAPGLVPHLADLASRAYRALRPPRELLVHPGFAQLACRFQFIQMSHHEARSLAAGASDIGILAQRLRQLQGEDGEFALTRFEGRGLLWADRRWWEIEPLGGESMDEARAGAVFCAAWVVARRFLRAPAAKALSFARSAAADSVLKK